MGSEVVFVFLSIFIRSSVVHSLTCHLSARVFLFSYRCGNCFPISWSSLTVLLLQTPRVYPYDNLRVELGGEPQRPTYQMICLSNSSVFSSKLVLVSCSELTDKRIKETSFSSKCVVSVTNSDHLGVFKREYVWLFNKSRFFFLRLCLHK